MMLNCRCKVDFEKTSKTNIIHLYTDVIENIGHIDQKETVLEKVKRIGQRSSLECVWLYKNMYR